MGTHEGNGTSDDQPVYHHHPDNHHHPILIVNSFGAMAAANGTPQVGTTQAHGQVSPVLGSPTRTGKAAFARNLHDMDYTVSGSTDLAGEPKESVGHQRGSDKAPMTERFELGAVLGSFGTVMVATERTTQIRYASKIIRKKLGHEHAMVQLQREILIMKKVRHPHIIVLKEVFETPDSVIFIMELCDRGELNKYVRMNPLTHDQVRLVLTRVTEAVAYLHDFGVVHRDIKPDNILLQSSGSDSPDDGLNVKLSDFGLVAFSDNAMMIENKAGTPFYMAPEVLNGNGYSQQCDVWSIGIIAFLLFCNFTEDSERMISKMVVADKRIEYPDEYFHDVPRSAIDAVDSMLQFDPAHRSTCREVLSHPWILGGVEGGSGSEGGDMISHRNVLRRMRAYNAELKLRKAMLTVRAMVRWRNLIREPQFVEDEIDPEQEPNGFRSRCKSGGDLLALNDDTPRERELYGSSIPTGAIGQIVRKRASFSSGTTASFVKTKPTTMIPLRTPIGSRNRSASSDLQSKEGSMTNLGRLAAKNGMPPLVMPIRSLAQHGSPTSPASGSPAGTTGNLTSNTSLAKKRVTSNGGFSGSVTAATSSSAQRIAKNTTDTFGYDPRQQNPRNRTSIGSIPSASRKSQPIIQGAEFVVENSGNSTLQAVPFARIPYNAQNGITGSPTLERSRPTGSPTSTMPRMNQSNITAATEEQDSMNSGLRRMTMGTNGGIGFTQGGPAPQSSSPTLSRTPSLPPLGNATSSSKRNSGNQ